MIGRERPVELYLHRGARRTVDTGATKDRAGLRETCAEGTVSLDEIGELAIELQSRLLRFMETGEVRRV